MAGLPRAGTVPPGAAEVPANAQPERRTLIARSQGGPPPPPPWVPRSPPPHLRCRRRSKVGWSGRTPPSGRGSKVGWQGRTLRVPPWGGTPGGVPCKVGLSTLNWLLLLARPLRLARAADSGPAKRRRTCKPARVAGPAPADSRTRRWPPPPCRTCAAGVRSSSPRRRRRSARSSNLKLTLAARARGKLEDRRRQCQSPPPPCSQAQAFERLEMGKLDDGRS